MNVIESYYSSSLASQSASADMHLSALNLAESISDAGVCITLKVSCIKNVRCCIRDMREEAGPRPVCVPCRTSSQSELEPAVSGAFRLLPGRPPRHEARLKCGGSGYWFD